MTVADTLKARLEDSFSPNKLEVIDESHLHLGHAGARPEGETHFRVVMTAEAFSGLNRVARQRKVYGVVLDLLEGPIHALSLKIQSPDEISS